jgi:hypothetical protein
MQACIGHFADPTIVLTTKEINLGIVENHKNDHSEIETTLLYANSPFPNNNAQNDILN